MVYRNSWIAGLAGLAFAFFMMNQLLRPTISGVPWQFVVAAGLLLGIIITWTAISYRLSTWLLIAANLFAMVITVVRVSAPETTALFLPTASSVELIRAQLDQAVAIVQSGIEPVIPVPGIVILITLVFWTAGALLAWGLLKGHPYVALVPPLVLSLQFATMDRAGTGLFRTVVFVLLVAGMILAITADERDSTAGRMAPRGSWPSARPKMGASASALLSVTVVGAVLAVGLFQSQVPYDGVLDWRNRRGYGGDNFGSVSYNPFISIQQTLVSNSNTPLFVAEIDGDLAPNEVYFKLLTMESYDGRQFYADRFVAVPLEERPWEQEGHAFAGETDAVTADISIAFLSQDWLPTAYSPSDLIAEETLFRSLRVRPVDGSIILDGGLSYEGMRYITTSDVPDPDVNVLALDDTGQLSPSFVNAADRGAELPETVGLVALPELRQEPPNVDVYLALPEDLDLEIAAEARLRTANLTTDFERGLALESWFHSEAFDYSTDIEPGHGATDLSAWLLDPESPNYHVGYCENFATAMAVMARTLDIPSRVVLGFTPGSAVPGETNQVVVRDRNAHAWVELWMPSQGWVRFDPTPRSQRDTPQTFEVIEDDLGFDLTAYLDVPAPDAIRREPPLGSLPELPEDVNFDGLPLPDGSSGSRTGFSLPGWLTTVTPFVIVALFLLAGIPLVKWWQRRRRMKRLEQGDISAAWEDIVTRLSDLGETVDGTLTPYELAAEFDPAMQPLATVYGRALYGPEDTLNTDHVETATRSLEQTTARLGTRYSTGRRVVAWYRPGTLLPNWLRDLRTRKKK
jgi:transglutaminase-like putative cysteine protease